jgi:hypothetical protein
MNNRECVLAVLTKHREARAWDDGAVADDLLMQLDIDPTAEAKNATKVRADTDALAAEIAAAEVAAKEADDKVAALRSQLDAVLKAAGPPPDMAAADARTAMNERLTTNDQADKDASAAIAKAAQDRREAEAEDDARAAAAAPVFVPPVAVPAPIIAAPPVPTLP